MNSYEALAIVGRARLAAHSGDLETAKTLLLGVRSEFNIYENSKISCEIQLAEGIVYAALAQWGAALDKFRRADLIGRMTSEIEVADFSCVWTSHCYFNVGRVLDSVDMLSSVASRAVELRAEARHRFCVALAQLFAFAGDRSTSLVWFNAARALAGHLHSRGLFSASLFNMCALRVWGSVHLSRLRGCIDVESVKDDLHFVGSSANYDHLTSVASRSVLHQILRAQLLGACGEYEVALKLLDELARLGCNLGGFELQRVELERLWCMLGVGREPKDLAQCRSVVEQSMMNLCDEDDLAFGHLLLMRVSELDGDQVMMNGHQAALRHYLVLLEERQRGVLEKLQRAQMPTPTMLADIREAL